MEKFKTVWRIFRWAVFADVTFSLKLPETKLEKTENLLYNKKTIGRKKVAV